MLHIHRAERADRLVDALAGVIATSLPDPMTPEVVAVPSRGIERWLAQELSTRLGTTVGRRDGVCANVAFPFPSRVMGQALAAAADLRPDEDPWFPDRLVWPLLETVDAHLHEAWLTPIRAHLRAATGDDATPTPARRYAAVRHVADLYDRYGVHRPEMVRAWAAGRDVDGSNAALDAAARWQPRLWRCVRERLGVPSPAERLHDAVDQLRDGLDVPGFPPRLALFGLTALPASYAALLAALAATRDVHLLLLHPSPVLWSRVAADVAEAPRRRRRVDDLTRDLPSNPLLASWGRDARELQLVVTGAAGAHTDDHHAVDDRPASLLARIQADVRADRLPPGAPATGRDDLRPVLDPRDRSIQVHACHGRTRQVEVLRDAILHLLAQDPTLEPRDVIVTCPDIEIFAPIVHAVFGARAVTDSGPAGDLPDLRVRLADRSIRQTNPVMRVVAELLELAQGRLTASQVLDLASREPVRRRFGFDDDDLQQLETWVADARIRWGLDGDHRARFGLHDVAANTWRAGIDRLLLGVTMADEDQHLVGGTVPLDDVEASQVDLAGRFAELIDRLAATRDALAGPHTVAGWRAAIAEASALLTVTAERERWQTVQVHRLLDEVVSEATHHGATSPVPLTLHEIRTLLAGRLRGRPTRANHRTGDLTVCTLVPMRSVPHRVMCLLGMDDGAFPRRTAPDGDDLVARDPHVGDRDPRTEDRQLLLDALLAATDTLVVTYTGRDERSNQEQPPAVPIGELLDVIDRTVRAGAPRVGGDEEPARDQVVIDHPLQPFDARNFHSGQLLADGPWGFDRNALAGARVRAAGQTHDAPFLPTPLAEVDAEDVIDLGEIVDFLQHPVKAFLRRRLGVTLPGQNEAVSDAIPVELAGLERHAVGEGLLTARLAGASVERWVRVERARGTLPPGGLADPLLDEITTTVDALVACASDHADLGAPRESIEVALDLPAGRTVTGTVPDVAGEVILVVQYSRVAPKHRLAAWARLVAATAAQPDRALRAVTVGRCRTPRKRAEVTVACLGPLGATAAERQRTARAQLIRLVDLYLRSRREPLPIYCDTSAVYAEAVDGDHDPAAAAHDAWTTEWTHAREDRDPHHVLVLGGVVGFDHVLGAVARDDETGDGWAADETSRFGRYARRLWEPLIAFEECHDR
ncbi:MAG: exodeoxyribonuclease V subunit gamma [Actinobacteria bacterium]|nr:exodeoxyribonuclease V subunit gamma [Actinomycetota bacterium]